jgi:hypothetical protein
MLAVAVTAVAMGWESRRSRVSKRSMERARVRDERRLARRRRRHALAAAAATGAAAAFGAASADAAPFTVTNLNDSGPGSLRDAITQANANPDADTIGFQSGLSGTIAVGSQMTITEDVEIAGPGPAAVTLDGGGATRIIAATGQKDVAISGLAFADGDAGGLDGGALSFTGGSGELDDVVVSGSSAFRGGAVFFAGNDLAITNSRFAGNEASYIGGAIDVDGYSGADPADSVSIVDSVVSGNRAAFGGGGIAFYDSYVDVLVDAATIADNAVTTAGPASNYEDGGGIWFEDTYDGHATTVSNSTVTGNSAPDAGGGISFGENFYGPTTVVNSTIAGNSSGDAGGGIQFADIENTDFALVDSTVTGNDAVRGGGVFRGYAHVGGSTDSPLDVSSSVVDGNHATGAGTDFAVAAGASGALTLGNTLAGSVAGVTYTADPAGSNIVGEDSKLRPLADNGGPTETMLPKPKSPLVDAGLANGLVKDQRDGPRTVDYPGVPSTHGSDGTDIGAAELDVLEDPFLSMAKPQLQSGKKVKLEVKAGAGEDVRATATGVIVLEKGNAVARMTRDRVDAGKRTTLTVKTKTRPGNRRIMRALSKGQAVTARIKGKLKDSSGNTYERTLRAKLKLEE